MARGIDLGFEGAHSQAHVRANRILLEELLGNLIDNAIRYTPDGGEATVRVELNAGTAVLRVEDNGPGIPEDERASVLERFHRGSAALQRSGSGLGLAIVREIAATHDADVRLEVGEAGCGTRVSVAFPLAQA